MAEQIVKDQKTLAAQVRAHQEQQARAAYRQGQMALREQLRQNTRQQQQDRALLADQSMLAQRATQQGAQSRGLGSSGLRDLASIQSQMAQGQAANQLNQRNADVQREALLTKLSMEDSQRDALSGASLTEMQSNVEADRYGYEQKKQDQQLVLELARMLENGESSEKVKLYAQLMGVDLGAELPGMEGKGSLDEILGGLEQTPDLYGDDKIEHKSRIPILDLYNKISDWTDPSKYILAALTGRKLNEQVGLFRHSAGDSWNVDKNYVIGGQKYRVKPSEALKLTQEHYADKIPVKNGYITFRRAQDGSIKVMFDNKTFSTYNKALEAYNNSKQSK